ncbi:MAG: Trm112 family protein [Pseudomonadota bacterium]
MNDTPPVPVPETSEGKLDRKVLEALVCPVTRGVLIYSAKDQELVSRGAGLAFPIRNGIPVMLVDEARKLDE